jgi:hypothetical protein
MTLNLQALMLECSRCRHCWLRRTASEPKFCPGCKTRLWNKDRVRHIAPERRAVVRDEPAKARTTVASRAMRVNNRLAARAARSIRNQTSSKKQRA